MIFFELRYVKITLVLSCSLIVQLNYFKKACEDAFSIHVFKFEYCDGFS